MNVIARLDFELAYYDSPVHRFNHYTTRTPIRNTWGDFLPLIISYSELSEVPFPLRIHCFLWCFHKVDYLCVVYIVAIWRIALPSLLVRVSSYVCCLVRFVVKGSLLLDILSHSWLHLMLCCFRCFCVFVAFIRQIDLITLLFRILL